MTGVLSDADLARLGKALRLAIFDPGAITPRGDDYSEPIAVWQARAVHESVLGPLLAEVSAGRERDARVRALADHYARAGGWTHQSVARAIIRALDGDGEGVPDATR